MISKFRHHPWHGIDPGNQAPSVVNAFIEITPNDGVKYEIDKTSGYLMIDRPQLYSNIVPALYGFIPMTYCGALVSEVCMIRTGRTGIDGDGDPLDILVLTEKNITHGDILVRAKAVGGIRMIDNNEADDKIIAILEDDLIYNHWNDLSDLPDSLINRLKHYFLTYKQIPNLHERSTVDIDEIYGREAAFEVIEAAIEDYQNWVRIQSNI